MTKEKKEIQTYGFDEFCKLAQDLLSQGFKFDFEDNQHYPTSFGTFYSAVMIKQAEAIKQVQKVAEGVIQAQEAAIGAVLEASVGALEEAADTAKARTKK